MLRFVLEMIHLSLGTGEPFSEDLQCFKDASRPKICTTLVEQMKSDPGFLFFLCWRAASWMSCSCDCLLVQTWTNLIATFQPAANRCIIRFFFGRVAGRLPHTDMKGSLNPEITRATCAGKHAGASICAGWRSTTYKFGTEQIAWDGKSALVNFQNKKPRF